MPTGKWNTEWAKAKKDFQTRTGQKKPPASVTKLFGGTGIKDQLKKCDEAFNSFTPEKDPKKKAAHLAKFTKEIAAYTKTANSYWMDIQKAMTKAKDQSIMAEMDVLRKELDSIRDTMTAQAGMLAGVLKKLSTTAIMAANIKKSIAGACKRALLFAAKIKTNPTADEWNSGIQTAARDITQQVGNVEKLRKKHDIVGLPESGAAGHFKILIRWADSPARLTTQQEILAERAALLNAVQNVIKWAGIN
ncbi:MAG: hypothetical protein P8M80_12815 [Pirellulaceae bacterium]|nr:hypothetical protein [Pirellulaceae bacterium]